MTSKKWLVMFAGIVVLALAVCGAVNALVDPFGVFGDPLYHWYSYDETNNPRVAKLAYLEQEHQQYDAYVIGSSSAAAYSVEELNGYVPDARFYNLFVYGCDTKDYCDFAAYVLEHYPIRQMILNVGINEANSYDTGQGKLNGQMHALTQQGQPLLPFYLQYALCNPKYSLEKIRAARQDTELPQVFDVFDVPTGTYDKRVRDVEKIGDPAVYEAAHQKDFQVSSDSGELPYIRECVQSVAEIRNRCAEKGVKLTVIASPVYIGQWELYREDALREFKTLLAREVDYWDFSYSSVSYDSRYFYDATHFRNAVGSMVLARIFGNSQVYVPEDFGVYVTRENCQAYLDQLFENPAAPDPRSYTADVPILMYHHFAPEDDRNTVVSPETLEEQLKAIARAGYTAVTFQELVDYVYHRGDLPEKPVVITMDDGYRSNYEIAWPLLEKYGLKATIFPIGSTVGNTEHYKDTEFPITPHFSFEEAREMMASGTVDIQSHTYDMHQWADYETGEEIRTSVLPLEGESDAHYAAALQNDLETYARLREQELGGAFCALAYPGGHYETLTEVLIHQAGIPVTLSIENDRRNVLVRGLPQSLYALCRKNVTEETTPQELLDYLAG